MSTPSRAVNAQPDPFWARLPAIIVYPFRGGAAITMVMLTLLTPLVLFPIIGRLVLLLMMAWAYKYAFEILRRTADGDMDPPEVILSVDNGVVWRFLGAVLVMGLVILVAALVTSSPTAVLIIAIAMGFLMPACAMTLAMTGSLSEALNPATLFSLIARVGWPYLAVVGMLIVIQATAIQASSILAHALPLLVAILVAVALSFWGLFAAFHLMGYLIFQSHEALGYEPAAFQRASERHEAPGDAVIAQAEPLIREGRTAEAIALLRSEVRSRAVSVEVHELYRRLLQKAGDPVAVQEHARQYLHQLMMEKQDRRALGVLREALDADPAFIPMDPEHGVRLAEQARLGGQPQLSADMLHALFNAHAGDARSAQWGLTAAMLLIERNRNEEAKILLERARTRTTDPVLLQKIDGALTLV